MQALLIQGDEQCAHNARTSQLEDGVGTSGLVNTRSTHFESMDLLRGVPLQTLVARAGVIWSDGGELELGQADGYLLSEKVNGIKRFISHSWRDSRWAKYLTFLWFHSSGTATVCGCGSGLLWLGASGLGWAPTVTLDYGNGILNVLGLSNVGFACGYLLALFAYVPCCVKEYCFLDKVCIHQSDPELKARGIASLGAFLRHSDRMMLLWSRDYFRRLWCNYEVACFTSLHGINAIDFCPLSLAPFVLVSMSLMLLALSWFFYVMWQANGDVGVDGFDSAIKMTFLPFLPFGIFAARVVADRCHLKRQLQGFTLKESNCFCCDVGHVHDGQTLLCDRVFVEGNIAAWFADNATMEERPPSGLELFQAVVREDMASHVRHLMGSPLLPVDVPTLYQAFAPFIFFAAEIATLSPDPRIRMMNVVEFLFVPFLVAVLFMPFSGLCLLGAACGVSGWCELVLDTCIGCGFFYCFVEVWTRWDSFVQDPSTPLAALAGVCAAGVLAVALVMRCA